MPHQRKELKIKGKHLWYLVGLITSDGCLSPDGRHIDITSNDYKFLQKLKDTIGLSNKIGLKYNARKQESFHIQFANRNFYDFLLSVGLTPAKSLTIEKVKVPENYFSDFVRGIIDGDGGLQRWIHPENKREQWNLRICSGSRRFLEWLQNKIEDIIGVRGKFYAENKRLFRLKYGKMAARVIAKECYYGKTMALSRKQLLAKECLNSYKGWSKSKTVSRELS